MKSARRLAKTDEVHTESNWLRDIILGGQDGLVNVLGIVLGVSAASGDTRILIAASLAAAFAEAVSMGAVAYTSTLAQRDHYLKELERENYEVDTVPEVETQEIRDLYQAKGFSGRNLESIVTTITSDKKGWVNTMMSEELGLRPIDTTDVLRSSAVVGVAAIIGAIIPIIPFFLLARATAIPVSLIISTISLFSVGVYEAKVYVGSWWRNGIQMALIGMGAAIAGFAIGKLFHVN